MSTALSNRQSYFVYNKDSKKFELYKKTQNNCKLNSNELPSKNLVSIECDGDVMILKDLKPVTDQIIPDKRFVFSAKDYKQDFHLFILEPGNFFKVSDTENLTIYTITGYE